MRRTRKYRGPFAVLFVIYLAVLVYLMFFLDLRTGAMAAGGAAQYNLVPFREIRRFFNYREIIGVWISGANLFGNILIFVPMGFFVSALLYSMRSVGKITLFAFCTSLCIELIQFFTKLGCFDVDDIILNTIGGLIGGVICLLAVWIRRRRVRRIGR